MIGGELQERLIPVPYSKSSTDQAVSRFSTIFLSAMYSYLLLFALVRLFGSAYSASSLARGIFQVNTLDLVIPAILEADKLNFDAFFRNLFFCFCFTRSVYRKNSHAIIGMR